MSELHRAIGVGRRTVFLGRADDAAVSGKTWARLEAAEREADIGVSRPKGGSGSPPPLLEVPSAGFNLPAPSDLDRMIRELENNLALLRRFRATFEDGPKVLPFREPAEASNSTELPFYGWVAAGKPADVDYYRDETMSVPGDFRRRPHYLLRVRGRSMEPDYPEGSYVVVRALEPGEYAKKGDIVIANDANGPAMKRLEYRKDGKKGDTPRKPTPHLVSINPDFGEVIPVSDCPIQGIVVDSFAAVDLV